MLLKIIQYDVHVIKASSLCPEHGYSTVLGKNINKAFQFIVALHSVWLFFEEIFINLSSSANTIVCNAFV